MTIKEDLISVIVPAYNAERFIARTLESILRQTHQNLEVLVVDDGSRDGTADIVRAYAKADHRVSLIQQPNGGVARARNTGIAKAKADLIAPCDADDLWSPEKLATQLAIFRAGGGDMGLVYSWSAVIDDDDLVQNYDCHPSEDGWVFDRMCKGNLIGNGSATLMSKQAVLQAGGYDPSLRDRGAQGCEDFKLYLWLSHKYKFGVMRDYGVGYRHTDGNMSSDINQMLRSYDIVIEEFAEHFPDKREELKNGYAELIDWFRLKALTNGRWLSFLNLQIRLMRYDWQFATKSLRWGVLRPIMSQFKWTLARMVRRRSFAPGEMIPGSHTFLGEPGDQALHRIGVWPDHGVVSRPPYITSRLEKKA
ncbi:MAG: glycosyltransferase family 2 protein [Hyphomonadaceae bacterium]|nr:glycosyltransferase family 2 protein [Hyphomonadaceae bacterium]